MTIQTAQTTSGPFYFARALRSRSFAVFWTGQTISNLGDGAFVTALAWKVLLMTHSGLAMGTLLLAQSIPRLIFILLGGLMADRLPRRLILLVSDVGRGITVLLIAALAWANVLQLWHLVILAIIFGAAGAFFGPAYQAIPPQLVEKEMLSSANALTVMSGQIGGLLGPLLGAGLVALFEPASAFAFEGLSFAVSVLSLFAIRSTAVPLVQSESKQQEQPQRRGLHGMLLDLREGFAYILGSTWLLWTVLVPAFGNLGYAGSMAVGLPKLVHDVYGAGAWLLGAIGTAEGLGWIGGAFLVGQMRLRRRGIVAFLGNIIAGLALMCFGLPFSPSIAPWIALVAAFVIGGGFSVLQTTWVTLLHELVPNEKLGRVASVDLLGSLGLLPIGYVVAGWLTDRFGPASVFLIGGGIIAVLDSIPLFLRGIREIS